MPKHGTGRIIAIASICMVASIACPTKGYSFESERSVAVRCQVFPEDFPPAKRKLGVALAGGGTKAASFSMGVLTALSELDAFGDVGAISSVSGGSYGAFFLFSKLILDAAPGRRVGSTAAPYFRDCIPARYLLRMTPDLAQSRQAAFCQSDEGDPRAEFRFQQFLRCRQDVLEGDCNFESGGADVSEFASIGLLSFATLISAIPSFLMRSVFDWPVNISPSRIAYREGIGTAYGLYPNGNQAFASRSLDDACREGAFRNCTDLGHGPGLDRAPGPNRLTFSTLRAAYADYDDMPLWISQATASRNRSLFGWAGTNRNNFDRYVFAMSPVAQCSGQFGNLALESDEGFDLLDAVNVSAAFFDANEKAASQPWRFLAATGQHLLNLDWGLDVHNPQIPDHLREKAHAALPIPFYYLDGLAARLSGVRDNQQSVYVRLHDGGNSDNLAAYSLIDNDFATILISDHSYDRHGEMLDLCDLVNEMARREKPLFAVLPAFGDIHRVCRRFAVRSERPRNECAPMLPPDELAACSSAPGVVFPIHQWRYPFIAGCVVNEGEPRNCDDERSRKLLLIKPAFDVARFIRTQLDDRGLVYKCGDDEELPCEAATYVHTLMKNDARAEGQALPARPGTHALFDFPQHSTVSLTLDSSAASYGAYKDLARSRTLAAMKAIRDAHGGYRRALDVQARCPLHALIDTGGGTTQQAAKVALNGDSTCD